MITFIYYLIHVVLLLIFIKTSNILSKCKDMYYWKKCIPIILCYSLEEGMRWARDIDWTLYYGVYEELSYGTSDFSFEFLFYFLFKTTAILGLPYSTFVAFCSFMWIFALCYFIRPYKKCIKYFLPICLLYFTVMASNAFRWYLAMSFFLIALRNLIDGRLRICIIFFFCTLGTHTAAFFMSLISVFLIVTAKNILLLKPIFVVIISLLLILFFNIEFIQNYINIFKYFSTERFDTYFNNEEQWFYSETHKGDRKNIIEYMLLMIPFYLILFTSYRLQMGKIIQDGNLFYNILIIWILFRSITSGIELLQRMSMYYEFVFVLMIAFTLVNRNNPTISSSRMLLIVVILFVMYKGYIGFFKPYGNEELMKYLWNSNLKSPKEARYIYLNQSSNN